MPLNFAILGASGNVGQLVVTRLLSYADDVVGKVKVINRRVIDEDTFPSEPRLVSHVVDMSSGDDLAESCEPILRDVDVVVSTMGIGSGKGTLEEFQKVEVELPSAFARAAARAGVRRAILLTSVGSNIESNSSRLTFFVADGQFFHLKGLVEKSFADAGFTDGLAIFRPAGLLGTDHLPQFVDWLLPKLDWVAPARFRSIHIDQLAYAIVSVAVDASKMPISENDVGVYDGHALFALLPGSRTRAGFEILA